MADYRKILSVCAMLCLTVFSNIAVAEDDLCCQDTYCDDTCCEDACCDSSWLGFPFEGDIGLAYDIFRSVPDGSWEGNTGALVHINVGMPVPRYGCFGLGFQVGGSYGLYDWSGRGSTPKQNPKAIQRQGYFTLGLFRKAPCYRDFNVGIALDWQANERAGVYAQNPSLGQFRFQVGYALNWWDEIGIWGTAATHSDRNTIPPDLQPPTKVKFRAVSQIDFFWAHRFENCARTNFWIGFPYRKSLIFPPHRSGRWILGTSFSVPLNCSWSLDGHASYMRAVKRGGVVESQNYASNICIGISYTFGNTGLSTCGDGGWKPYLPIADNTNFITDANSNY